MIIKRRDSKEADINELTSLLALPLPEEKRWTPLVGQFWG
jgi:hypothetical protein